MTVKELRALICSKKMAKTFSMIYGKDQIDSQRKRYLKVLEEYVQSHKIKEDTQVDFYRIPGRTEIDTSNKDNQHGKGSSMCMDTIGIVVKKSSNIIDFNSSSLTGDADAYEVNKMTVKEISEILSGENIKKTFSTLYGPDQVDMQQKRYLNALEQFVLFYGVKEDDKVSIYRAPGRTEVAGNHTDHQHGRVLAASVCMDIIGFVKKNGTDKINLKSEGFPVDKVDISSLDLVEDEKNTSAALIRGVCAYFKKHGKNIGGFDAYTTSNVPKGSGLSSSAAFEMFLGCAISYEFCGVPISPVENAIAGQFAESQYFGKPCGLMDQLASAFGGLIAIDFRDPDNPVIQKARLDLEQHEHILCAVDTGGSHANLTHEYASIPEEMKAVAAEFDKKVLRDVNEGEFFQRLPELREKLGDRPVLRALHFFGENRRVGQIADTLAGKYEFSEFLSLIKGSGYSSLGYLQNMYSSSNVNEQGLSLGLAISEYVLQDRGAYRVHGGGFGGSIIAFVPNDMFKKYKAEMEKAFGVGACQELCIRPYGAVSLMEVYSSGT